MSPEVLQLASQLGVGGILLYLLLEERKARIALETRVFDYLNEWLDDAKEQSRPRRPEGLPQ